MHLNNLTEQILEDTTLIKQNNPISPEENRENGYQLNLMRLSVETKRQAQNTLSKMREARIQKYAEEAGFDSAV